MLECFEAYFFFFCKSENKRREWVICCQTPSLIEEKFEPKHERIIKILIK